LILFVLPDRIQENMPWWNCCSPSRQWRVWLVLGLLVLAAFPVRADLAKGLAAYKAGDFATAQREFRLAAEAGDATAMLSLGFLYLHGEGVPANPQEAVHWLQLAAERGLAPAQHSLALAYYEGRGVARNATIAANYFESAALQGLADAQYNLGVLYARGDGVPQDWVRARFWHEKAAEQGVTDSQLALGVMYANGQGVGKDYAEAARWLAKAAEAGNGRARRTLETGFGEPARLVTPNPTISSAAPREPTGQIAPSAPAKEALVSAPVTASPSGQAPAPMPAPSPNASTTGASRVPETATPLRRNSWRAAPDPLSPQEFQQLQARAVSGEAEGQRRLAQHYYHGISTRRNLLRAYVWAKRAGAKGDALGEAMAKGMHWELDDQLRAIAERLLASPESLKGAANR
jgi:TPR repeat protein